MVKRSNRLHGNCFLVNCAQDSMCPLSLLLPVREQKSNMEQVQRCERRDAMSRRTAEQVIEQARANFERGDRRAAWDSLLVMARRNPKEGAYRAALVDLYRRAGSLDQAGRWGAQNLELLTDGERLALRRSLRQVDTDEKLRRYLAIRGDLPPEVLLLPTRSPPSNRASRLAESLESAAGIILVFLGVWALILGVGATFVLAFLGERGAQQAAQITASMALFVVIAVSALFGSASALRARWGRTALFVVVVILAIVGLGQADMTTPLPFER